MWRKSSRQVGLCWHWEVRAWDGPVGHVLVGKREKNLVMRRGGAPEVLTNYGAPDEKRNQSDMEVLVTY